MKKNYKLYGGLFILNEKLFNLKPSLKQIILDNL